MERGQLAMLALRGVCIDEAVGTQDLSGWSALASVATIAFRVFAIVAVFLVRGRVGDRPDTTRV